MTTFRRPQSMPRSIRSMVKPHRTVPTRRIVLPEPFASDPRLFWLGILFVALISITLIVAWIIGSPYLFPTDTVSGAASKNGTSSSQLIIPNGSEYTRPLARANDPAPREWDGASRVTILVVGLDARDGDGDLARTDSMILFSMDPVTHTAGMLSIPRDMWATIPGYGQDKINTAYYKGELDQIPGGGPGLAIRTVEQFIGMPINYFAQIDFNSFVKFIDETGGVDIKVKEPMVIDPVGPNNTINLKPGTQTLNGAQALAYARVRDMGHGDFDRAARQQQVIMAVRDNILNYYSLPKLILKAPAIYNDVAGGVRTNLSIADAIRMAYLVQQIDVKNIQHGVINEPDQVTASFDNAGEYILLPDMKAILALRDQVFSLTPQAPVSTVVAALTQAPQGPVATAVAALTQDASNNPQAAPATIPAPLTAEAQPTAEPPTAQPSPTPTIPLSPQDAAKAEKAQVIVLNGTSMVGLASRTHEYFMLKGLRVIKDGNADNPAELTEIRVSANKPATVAYIASLLNVPPSRIFNQTADPNNPADVVVIVGVDWATHNDMP